MRDVVVVVHQTSRHSKITYLERESDGQMEGVCMRVMCVCEREREGGREGEREREREREREKEGGSTHDCVQMNNSYLPCMYCLQTLEYS